MVFWLDDDVCQPECDARKIPLMLSRRWAAGSEFRIPGPKHPQEPPARAAPAGWTGCGFGTQARQDAGHGLPCLQHVSPAAHTTNPIGRSGGFSDWRQRKPTNWKKYFGFQDRGLPFMTSRYEGSNGLNWENLSSSCGSWMEIINHKI